MGWTSVNWRPGDPYRSTAEQIRKFVSDEMGGGSHTVLAAASNGSTVYLAVQYTRPADRPADTTRPATFVYALVVLTRYDKRRGSLFYKEIGEMEGPYERKCPKRILSMLSAPVTEYSRQWREDCLAYHAGRSRRSPKSVAA